MLIKRPSDVSTILTELLAMHHLAYQNMQLS